MAISGGAVTGGGVGDEGARHSWRVSGPLNIVHPRHGGDTAPAARRRVIPRSLDPNVFENVRDAFRDLLRQQPDPDARRDILAQMRETLVRARMGLDDLRRGIAESEARVAAERREVATMQRRRALAEGIDDAETLALALKYEQLHAERLAVLERKLDAQRAELAMVESEVQEMTAELKLAGAGAVPGRVGSSGAGESPFSSSGSAPGDDPLGDDATLRDLNAMDAARRRAEQESNADDMLQALKRRMGK